MDKYACQVSGYVYDPAKGDPDARISAGTRFEDLPSDWVCPLCGASKEMFEKVGRMRQISESGGLACARN